MVAEQIEVIGQNRFCPDEYDLLRGSRPFKTAGTFRQSRNKRVPQNRALKVGVEERLLFLAVRCEHLQTGLAQKPSNRLTLSRDPVSPAGMSIPRETPLAVSSCCTSR